MECVLMLNRFYFSADGGTQGCISQGETPWVGMGRDVARYYVLH